MPTIYLPTERGAALRRLEDRVSRVLDPEHEAWEMRRRAFVQVGDEVRAVKRITGGSFVNPIPTDAVYINQTAGTAKNTFTTEVGINDTAGMGPQGKLNPYFFDAAPTAIGKSLRVVARGILSTTSAPTYTFTFRLGASGITGPITLGSAALTAATTVTNQIWEFEGDVQLSALGAAGANSTLRGLGLVTSPAGLASPFAYALFGGAASPGTVATFDISITNFLNFNVACGTSNASNSIQLLQLIVLGLN